jgi:hypothetical protein
MRSSFAMRHHLAALLLSVGLSTTLTAQSPSNDYAGIVVSAYGVTPAPNSVGSYPTCGSPFSCTPLTLNAQAGDTARFYVMGTFNGLAVLAATLDPTTVCIPLGIPGIVNNMILVPGPALTTLFIGTCSVPDNGRCNGGATPSTVLFVIPPGLHGVVGLQALVGAPLSVGGTGLALTRAVQITF